MSRAIEWPSGSCTPSMRSTNTGLSIRKIARLRSTAYPPKDLNWRRCLKIKTRSLRRCFLVSFVRWRAYSSSRNPIRILRKTKMNLWKMSVCLAITLNLVAFVFGQNRQRAKVDTALAAKIRRFAPTALTADTAHLSVADRKALQKIIAAAKYFDPLYRRQLWSGNEALRKKLEADKSALGRERLHYYLINAGPWSQLDSNEAFLEGVPPKPPQ